MKKYIFLKNLFRLFINRSKLKIIRKFIIYSLDYYNNRKKIVNYNNIQIQLLTKDKKVSEIWFAKNIYFLDQVFDNISQKK